MFPTVRLKGIQIREDIEYDQTQARKTESNYIYKITRLESPKNNAPKNSLDVSWQNIFHQH